MHPILFHLGPMPIRAYGVLILIGFSLALRYLIVATRRRNKRIEDGSLPQGVSHQPVPEERVFDMAILGLLIGIIGTRVVFVALHWDLFRDDPWEIFRIWMGGLSFIGGPLFGYAFAWWYCHRHRLPYGAVADMAAPGFALAYAFGRIGCFLNGCCYGRACDLPWAVRFQSDGAVSAMTPPSHPTQLYASLMSLVIFAVLHRKLNRAHADGTVLVTYLILYAVYRFINDFFRAGATSRIVALGLTDGQATALIAVPFLLLVLVRLNRSAGFRSAGV